MQDLFQKAKQEGDGSWDTWVTSIIMTLVPIVGFPKAILACEALHRVSQSKPGINLLYSDDRDRYQCGSDMFHRMNGPRAPTILSYLRGTCGDPLVDAILRDGYGQWFRPELFPVPYHMSFCIISALYTIPGSFKILKGHLNVARNLGAPVPELQDLLIFLQGLSVEDTKNETNFPLWEDIFPSSA